MPINRLTEEALKSIIFLYNLHMLVHQTIVNNLKVDSNDAHYAVIYQHKCDVIVLTQEITALVIDFCMKTLKTGYLDIER